MHWVLAHLIGDFILQTDWMVANKKKSSLVCSIHTLFYIIPFFFSDLYIWQILLIGVQHGIQDRTNFVLWFSILTGSKNFVTKDLAPWSLILMDQILHILFISMVVSL